MRKKGLEKDSSQPSFQTNLNVVTPPPMFIYTGEASFLLYLSHSHSKRGRHNVSYQTMSMVCSGVKGLSKVSFHPFIILPFHLLFLLFVHYVLSLPCLTISTLYLSSLSYDFVITFVNINSKGFIMYNIDTPYMNECFRRASSEQSHAIHCNNHEEVLSYLRSTYNMQEGSSHVQTNNGSLFELKLSAKMGNPTTYVTLIAV